MSDDINSRVRRWKRPLRPDWVQRINEEGRHLDLKSVVPLDEGSLIGCAKANTGLSDFGVDDWYEPFKVFIRALDEESDLTLMGRLMTRSDVLMNLEARLRIEETYKRHPEIDEEEIQSPIWIIGSGRCGSSAMQNLLSHDPDNGTPKHWEAMFPCPPPLATTYLTDPRIAIADKRTDMWNRVTPEIMSMHEFRGYMPTELIHIEAMSFQSRGFLDLYGFVPTYDAYMAKRSSVPALSYAKRALKLLQWKNPRKRWLMETLADQITGRNALPAGNISGIPRCSAYLDASRSDTHSLFLCGFHRDLILDPQRQTLERGSHRAPHKSIRFSWLVQQGNR
jgi:hypothetical protein